MPRFTAWQFLCISSAQFLSPTLGITIINRFIGFDDVKEPTDGPIADSSLGSLVEEEEVDTNLTPANDQKNV